MKLAEWPPPSFNEIKFMARLCRLIPNKLIQETIREPGGSVEMIEEP